MVGTEDVLGIASQVLGLDLDGQVLGLGLGLGGQVLGLGLGLVTSGLDSKSDYSLLTDKFFHNP